MTYDGKRAADIAVSRYAVRHLVAVEVRFQTLGQSVSSYMNQIDAQFVGRQADAVEKTKGSAHGLFGKKCVHPLSDSTESY